jgi:phage recombination protein Bet
MTEEKNLVKYQSRDGQEIILSFDTVRKYLIQGNRDKVTEQELMLFLGVCKSRGLNPFKKDAYLVKYGDDPAAIITSIHYFRARARAQKDCRGWKSGVIVREKDGSLRYSDGLVLDEEELLGGWFEAKPDGWDFPVKLEVNLGGYIERMNPGNTARFWQPENQPTMIAKVAEAQGLRKLWPDEFQQLYGEEEIVLDQTQVIPAGNGTEESAKNGAIQKFKDSIPENIRAKGQSPLLEFVEKTAQANRSTVDDLMVAASKDLESFWAAYRKWAAAKAKEAVADFPAPAEVLRPSDTPQDPTCPKTGAALDEKGSSPDISRQCL